MKRTRFILKVEFDWELAPSTWLVLSFCNLLFNVLSDNVRFRSWSLYCHSEFSSFSSSLDLKVARYVDLLPLPFSDCAMLVLGHRFEGTGERLSTGRRHPACHVCDGYFGLPFARAVRPWYG